MSETEKIMFASEKCLFTLEMIFSTMKMIASIKEKIGFVPQKTFSKPKKIASRLKMTFFFSDLIFFGPRKIVSVPEKIFFVENGKVPRDLHVEAGTIRDVLYAGMVTRYLVDLEAGGELQVVRQNLGTSSVEVQALRGRKVKIGWRADQTVAVKGEEEGK